MSPHPAGQHRRSAIAVLAAIVLVLLVPASASADAEIQSSVPEQGAVVPSPFSGPIALTFTESLAVGSKAELYGPGHELVASATIDAGTMTVSPPSPLPAGDYTVEWVSIGDDGDLLRGIVAFTVAAAGSSAEASASIAPSTAVTNPPSAAASGVPSASAAPVTPSPTPTPAGNAGGGGSDVVLPIVIVLLLAAASAFYLVRRNRPA
ncbi:MAG TPA: copper resistance protein CopC [Candidatus Limnocylindrales bacterium]